MNIKDTDQNAVISWGLAIMGILSVAGWIWISLQTGTSSGTEIPLSLSSGLVGVLTGKKIAEVQMRHELSKLQNEPPKEPNNLPVKNLDEKEREINAESEH